MPKSDVTWAVQCVREMHDVYATYEDYYIGNHPLLFATEKFRNAFGALFREFADNLCPPVVDAVADRLIVTGWNGGKSSEVEKLWKKYRLDRVEREVHVTAPKKGDAYLIVWPAKDGTPRFWPQEPDNICVEYDDDDDPNKIVKAGKVWIDSDDFGRCTLYYEDTIERYETTQPVKSGALPDKPYRWTQIGAIPNIYGRVPVFHFGNDAPIGDLGTSELIHAIPIQNGLNKSLCDLLVAMEFVALPQRWATGLQVEVDEDSGKPKNPPFTPGVDRIWAAGEGVNFGQFAPADLRQFLDVNDSFRLEMMRLTGTPPHFVWLEKNLPSGEALRTIEGRLVKKIERRQTTFGDVWTDLVKFLADMDSSAPDIADDPDLRPTWANASPHNPLLDAETQLVKEQVGLSHKQSLRELGYTEDQIDQMFTEREEEASMVGFGAQIAVNPQDPSGRPTAFNRNGKPGQPSKPAPQQQQPQYKGVPVPTPRASHGAYEEG